ncbi:hypothetical protein AURDEDRAFT_60572 [Auricularia subglabra TFB-10046 SS5]|nr:hypothetical protein AURDEDRAFT_60572 [Auricularia subglabra TFB-10046 SS5]
MSGSTAAHNDSTPDEDPTKTPIATSKPGLHRRRSSAATGKSGVNLTLREQEKVIDSLKKENFSLKLKVHFLEERLQENNPEHVELALKQNINLKIEVQARGVEIKRLKKQLREFEVHRGTLARPNASTDTS